MEGRHRKRREVKTGGGIRRVGDRGGEEALNLKRER